MTDNTREIALAIIHALTHGPVPELKPYWRYLCYFSEGKQRVSSWATAELAQEVAARQGCEAKVVKLTSGRYGVQVYKV